MATTVHRLYPLPVETKSVREEIENLQLQVLPMLDNDIHALFVAIADLAPAEHGHEIGDITGLIDALAGKMPADTVFSLSDLVDVEGADEAADGYVIVKNGPLWVAQAALAALGTHGHSIAQVSGLSTALTALGDRIDALDNWALQPLGVPIAVNDHIAGLAPPTNKAYRYIKLSAADAYNGALLTTESVSGSAPDVQATAVVSSAGSPLHGAIVRLINTERRYLRAGSSGTVAADSLRSHTHTGAADSDGAHIHTGTANSAGAHVHGGGLTSGTGAFGSTNGGIVGGNTASGGAHTHPLTIASGGAHTHPLTIDATGATETRVKDIGVTYYMRIK